MCGLTSNLASSSKRAYMDVRAGARWRQEARMCIRRPVGMSWKSGDIVHLSATNAHVHVHVLECSHVLTCAQCACQLVVARCQRMPDKQERTKQTHSRKRGEWVQARRRVTVDLLDRSDRLRFSDLIDVVLHSLVVRARECVRPSGLGRSPWHAMAVFARMAASARRRGDCQSTFQVNPLAYPLRCCYCLPHTCSRILQELEHDQGANYLRASTHARDTRRSYPRQLSVHFASCAFLCFCARASGSSASKKQEQARSLDVAATTATTIHA